MSLGQLIIFKLILNDIFMKTNYVSPLFLMFLGLYGCSSDDDAGNGGSEMEMEYSSGTADFSNYVAVGNSLTAGYTDGALFVSGQSNSLPNILSQQFALVGGGEFQQPLTNDNIGGLLAGGFPLPGIENRLYFNGSGPARLPGSPTTDIAQTLSGSFNNMGVPGAFSYHLLSPGYGNIAGVAAGLANPYFVRFASSPSTTVIADAVAQKPTFFSLWIGNNDVLGYATGGGVGIDQTGNLDYATYALNDITDPTIFADIYTAIVSELSKNDAKGIVANIPDVTGIPYFTTVPYAPLDPTNPDFGSQIPMLNNIFGALNQVYEVLGAPERKIEFATNAASAVVIKDEALTDISAQIEGVLNASPTFPAFISQFGLPAQAVPLVANILGQRYGQSRQANEADLIVLPSSNVIGTVNVTALQALMGMGVPQELAGQFSIEGITLPLEDKWVLIPSEQASVKTATDAYNMAIATIAQQNDLALVDANAIMKMLSQGGGVPFDEFILNSSLVFGGAFSLDGVHPTARGYAYLANKFMEAIEKKYNAVLPRVRAADYNTLYPAQLP